MLSGIALYFFSPKVNLGDFSGAMKIPGIRFFTVEHPFMMLLAVTLITVSYMRIKRLREEEKKLKTGAYLFLLALIIILYSIPWPFSKVPGNLF
jgi:hypothetical protein